MFVSFDYTVQFDMNATEKMVVVILHFTDQRNEIIKLFSYLDVCSELVKCEFKDFRR